MPTARDQIAQILFEQSDRGWLNAVMMMKKMIFALTMSLPAAASAADALNIKARDHSCGELEQIIRQEKKVFVRSGIGGQSFRYPPARCNLGDMHVTARLKDANGKLCLLNYACVTNPADPRNFNFSR